MFKITCGKGFCMTFANGYSLSVQWGYENYCDNRWQDITGTAEQYDDNQRKLGEKGSYTAEIAIFNPDNHMLSMKDTWGDDVKGHCTADEVLEWMIYTSKL